MIEQTSSGNNDKWGLKWLRISTYRIHLKGQRTNKRCKASVGAEQNSNLRRKYVFVIWKRLPSSIVSYKVIDAIGTAAHVELEVARKDAILTLIEKEQALAEANEQETA